jgi:hypothetical protein
MPECKCCLMKLSTNEQLETHLQDAHWIGLSNDELNKRIASLPEIEC